MSESTPTPTVTPESSASQPMPLRQFTGQAEKISPFKKRIQNGAVVLLTVAGIGTMVFLGVSKMGLFTEKAPEVIPVRQPEAEVTNTGTIQPPATSPAGSTPPQPEVAPSPVPIQTEVEEPKMALAHTHEDINLENLLKKIAEIEAKVSLIDAKLEEKSRMKPDKSIAVESTHAETITFGILDVNEKMIQVKTTDEKVMNIGIGTPLPGGALFLGFSPSTRTIKTSHGDFLMK